MIDTIVSFIRLNGYGIFVWPAFAFAAVVLAWMGVTSVRRLRTNERALAELQEIRERIASRGPGGKTGP